MGCPEMAHLSSLMRVQREDAHFLPKATLFSAPHPVIAELNSLHWLLWLGKGETHFRRLKNPLEYGIVTIYCSRQAFKIFWMHDFSIASTCPQPHP